MTAACGRNGGFCQTCDTSAGQTCTSGTCSGGTNCNANNCSGCCNGNTCVTSSGFNNTTCGQGLPGAACVSCIGTQSCQGGVCSGSMSDGGLPGLDGGFGAGCVDNAECGSGECCDSFGTTIGGACISSGTACQFGGANFQVCLFFGSCTCNGLTQTCE